MVHGDIVNIVPPRERLTRVGLRVKEFSNSGLCKELELLTVFCVSVNVLFQMD